jgi:hypothetical protein
MRTSFAISIRCLFIAIPLLVAPLSAPAVYAANHSLVLRGTGSLTGTDASCTTSSPTCPGTFTATVSGRLGRTVKPAALQINFQVQNPSYANIAQTGGPVLGCYVANGTGTFLGSGYRVGFAGQFCVPDGNTVELAGPIWIVQSQATISAAVVTWATGTLVATGSLHTFAPDNPVPVSGMMAVSVSGTTQRIPPTTP